MNLGRYSMSVNYIKNSIKYPGYPVEQSFFLFKIESKKVKQKSYGFITYILP